MNTPYKYNSLTSDTNNRPQFQLLYEDEPLCILDTSNTRMIIDMVKYLNDAFNIGMELGQQSIHTKELYTYGMDIKNLYSLELNARFNETLLVNDMELQIILPDNKAVALTDMNLETARKFVNLMNQAHRKGFAEGLTYSEDIYNTPANSLI